MIRPRLSKFADNEKGAAMVEFAIIFPLLLLVIFGVIEWGLYMYNRQVITNAAREGARHGVIMRVAPRNLTAENTAIRSKIAEYANTNLITFGTDTLDKEDPDDMPITRSPAGSLSFGSDLTVEVIFEYEFLFLSIPPLSIGPLIINGEATMKME